MIAIFAIPKKVADPKLYFDAKINGKAKEIDEFLRILEMR